MVAMHENVKLLHENVKLMHENVKLFFKIGFFSLMYNASFINNVFQFVAESMIFV